MQRTEETRDADEGERRASDGVGSHAGTEVAEGEGFEPPGLAPSRFQDDHIKPL